MAADLASRASDFLARIGDRLKRLGLPEPQGQVFGWLMIADPPCQTAAEIAGALRLPEPAVRDALAALRGFDLLDRVQAPGMDAPCYALKSVEQLMAARATQLDAVLRVLDDGLFALADEPPPVTARLAEYRDFYGYMRRELPGIMAAWRQEQPVEGP